MKNKDKTNQGNLKKYESCKTCPNRQEKKLCCCGCVFDFCRYSLED